MAIIRVQHTARYTTISNASIRDTRPSFKARGVHHLLLSYPDNWRVNSEHLATQSDGEGRDSIRSALRELEDFGYIKRVKAQDEKGRFYTECLVFEEPQGDENQPNFVGLTDAGKPVAGQSGVGSSGVGNSGAYISTDLRKPDLRNTDLKSTYQEIKDPYKSPSGSEGMNPEPRLSSLRESENSIDVDFWEEGKKTPCSDSQNPPPRTQENNGQDMIADYDTPQSLLGAFKQGKSDSNAIPQEQTSLLLFSNPGVAIYSAAPETVSKKKKPKKVPVYVTGFHDIFWPIVAHKTNKPGSLIKWANTEGVDPWVVREAYMRQFEAHVKAGNDPKFFRRPETWLSQFGWEDEIPDPRLAEMRQKTPAELREEEKQREWAERKAETIRLINLRQEREREKELARQQGQMI